MMLGQHRGGDRAMNWRGFGAIFEWTLIGSSSALPQMLGWVMEFVGPVSGRAEDGYLKPQMLGWVTEFVRPVAERAADGCLNDARTGLKTSSQ